MTSESTSSVKRIQSVAMDNEMEQTINVDGEICKFGDLVWIIMKNRTHRPSTTTLIKYYAYSQGVPEGQENAFEAVLDKHLSEDARQKLIEPVVAMGAVVQDGMFMHRGEFRDFDGNVFVVQNKLPDFAEAGGNRVFYKADNDGEPITGDISEALAEADAAADTSTQDGAA